MAHWYLTGQNAEKIAILYWILYITVLVFSNNLVILEQLFEKQVFIEVDMKCNSVIKLNIGT